jgi:hypothetical protein
MQTWMQQNSGRAVTGPQAASKSSATQSSSNASPAAPTPAAPSSRTSEFGPELTSSALISNAGNRRGEQRLACKLGAEVYRLGTSVPNRCTLSDISEGGCYVEMPSPLSGQSAVEILVRTADTKLRIRGQVLTTHPGFGMGVRFMFRDSTEREEVLRLLAILTTGPSLDERLR